MFGVEIAELENVGKQKRGEKKHRQNFWGRNNGKAF